jgi:thiamine-phosphate pyrophosphorylase
VTDGHRLTAAGTAGAAVRQCLLAQARHAVDASVDMIHLRERDADARALASLGAELVALTRGSRTRVVINDRLDVALACGADGVHLREDSIPAAAVRSIVPRGFLVGQSVHSVEAAVAAGSHADYLVAGTVWPSASKPAGHPLLGLDGFAAVTRAVPIPVLAIGGVTVDRVPDVARAGGAGIAAIGLFIVPASLSSCRAGALIDTVRAVRMRFDTDQPRS